MTAEGKDPRLSALQEQVRALARIIIKAQAYAVSDPEVALTQARKSAEAICRSVFARDVGEPGPKMMLDDLIRKLAEKKAVPQRILVPLGTIQAYGNFGTHAQADLGDLDPAYVVPCFSALAQVTNWYFTEFLGIRVPDDITAAQPSQHASPGVAAHATAGSPKREGVVEAGRSPGPAHWPTDRSVVRIANVEDVIAWGWDGHSLLEHLIALDYSTIRGLHEGNEGAPEQWAPVFMDHPDTWRLLVDGPGSVVGYWHFVPLFDNEYARAKEGRLLDGDITTDKVCFLEVPGVYQAYFVSITMLPRFRGARNFRLLLDALFENFIELAERGVFFDEVCANAFTPEGTSLCRTLGMTYRQNHADQGKIYSISLVPPPKLPLLRNYPDFVKRYSELGLGGDRCEER